MILERTIKQMQPKKDWPTFNIRKVQRKGQFKQQEDLQFYTPQCQFQKYPDGPIYSNGKKQKDMMIDYSVNEAIVNSKAYTDLKQSYNQNKRKNSERKQELAEEVEKLKKQKEDAIEEEKRLELQRRKFEEILNELKDKILEVRQKNRYTRDVIQNKMSNEAEYLSNLLISMRFQAEYQHDIDPDQMTYEELLQLEQKIGSVSRGLPLHIFEKLPYLQIENNHEDQCPVCVCPMQTGEIIMELPPCKHSFHRDCLKGWLSKEKVCPLCKRQVMIE